MIRVWGFTRELHAESCAAAMRKWNDKCLADVTHEGSTFDVRVSDAFAEPAQAFAIGYATSSDGGACGGL